MQFALNEIQDLKEIVMQSTSPNTTNPPLERGLEQITVIVNGSGAHRRKRLTPTSAKRQPANH